MTFTTQITKFGDGFLYIFKSEQLLIATSNLSSEFTITYNLDLISRAEIEQQVKDISSLLDITSARHSLTSIDYYLVCTYNGDPDDNIQRLKKYFGIE